MIIEELIDALNRGTTLECGCICQGAGVPLYRFKEMHPGEDYQLRCTFHGPTQPRSAPQEKGR